jgi:hypothetical protein
MVNAEERTPGYETLKHLQQMQQNKMVSKKKTFLGEGGQKDVLDHMVIQMLCPICFVHAQKIKSHVAYLRRALTQVTEYNPCITQPNN